MPIQCFESPHFNQFLILPIGPIFFCFPTSQFCLICQFCQCRFSFVKLVSLFSLFSHLLISFFRSFPSFFFLFSSTFPFFFFEIVFCLNCTIIILHSLLQNTSQFIRHFFLKFGSLLSLFFLFFLLLFSQFPFHLFLSSFSKHFSSPFFLSLSSPPFFFTSSLHLFSSPRQRGTR